MFVVVPSKWSLVTVLEGHRDFGRSWICRLWLLALTWWGAHFSSATPMTRILAVASLPGAGRVAHSLLVCVHFGWKPPWDGQCPLQTLGQDCTAGSEATLRAVPKAPGTKPQHSVGQGALGTAEGVTSCSHGTPKSRPLRGTPGRSWPRGP